MNIKEIKYIGFYDDLNHEKEKRCKSLAAVNKMDYITNTLVKIGYVVTIISPSWTANSKGFYKKRKEKIAKNIFLKTSATFGTKIRIMKIFRILYAWIWLFFYLIKNTKKDENVIVYHSLMLAYPVYLAKKIKKFKLVLELEEIYQDVMEYSSFFKWIENEMIASADKFLFSTELLNKYVNTGKPFCVNYGIYKAEENIVDKPKDGKIHIVYAGIIDNYKGGAAAAVRSAQYLDANYHIHIIGFGSKDDLKQIINLIDETNKNSQCKVSYDGLLKGREYISFLKKCQIGYCTQMSKAKYNDTSFPSKILSYLSNGLRVVSIRIKAVENSKIADMIYFYNEDSPKRIAEAVRKVDLKKPYDSRKRLQDMDADFTNEMRSLLFKN